MATADSVKRYENAAEITDYWIQNVAPRYFNMENVNTYKAGTLGYITDVMATTTEDSIHAMMIARREFYPNTAQYLKSLYLHAASRYMSAPMAIPATANILLMIQQSDILKYGETEGALHTFVLDDTFIAYVDEIPFMLDYPIKIISKQKENGKYAHTTHYDFYIHNSLVSSPTKYLPNKVMNYKGTEYLIIAVGMRQMIKTYDSQLVTSNTIVNTVTMDFNFDGHLANFEVFYKENDTKARVQLEKKMTDSGIPNTPFCWYTIVDDTTIRLQFPANAYFMPRLNSTISIEIATTDGTSGNFDSYNSDIVSANTSTRYPYNSQVPVFGTVDGKSSGGADIIDVEEFRNEVTRAYSTNHTYTTVNDLQLFFDKLLTNKKDNFKFVKKRDDAFIRLYGAFLLMNDNGGNVVPTNTLDMVLDPLKVEKDFDLYSEAVKRFIIRPGALFTYYHDKDNQYNVHRIHDRALHDNLDDYGNGTHYSCTNCGTSYEGSIPFSVLPETYVCPVCGKSKSQILKDKFVFTNPYLISVSIDNFAAGYFLNSREDHHELTYSAVNDESIIQFISKHFKVTRNAVSGENFYRFSIAISPSVEIDETTIFAKNDGNILAKHNGFVSQLAYKKDAVYATIVYTDDGTLEGPIPDSEKSETIQVSSYVTKTNQTYYICPICGKRMSVADWKKAEAANFLEADGTDMFCTDCKEPTTKLSTYVSTYVDYDYFPGNDMKFVVGDHLTKNDVIATAKPTDLGRTRVMLDLNDVMSSYAHRYIPMVLEEAHVEDTQYYIYAAYISTDDMIDSSMIMPILDGYVMQDGSSGHNSSLSIPIEGLSMKIHTFYEYREADALGTGANPKHNYSDFNYVSMRTFTNTYELQDKDSITLIKSLDQTRGFLDAIEREIPLPPAPPEPIVPPHPPAESTEHPNDPNSIYIRSMHHERFKVPDVHSDQYPTNYLTIPKPPIDPPIPPKPDPEKPLPDTTWPPKEGEYGDNFKYKLRNCPMVSAAWMKKSENETYFFNDLAEHYREIERVQWTLENGFSIDMKFYNSYGKSKFYKIGNHTLLGNLDSVNITLSFGASIDFPSTVDVFRTNFRTFVKEYIEATDDMVGNGIDLYIMNLIAAAKTKFDEINYLEYYGLNEYDFSAQRITVMSDEEIIATVKADSFVPEFLNIIRETVNGTTQPVVNLAILNS